MPAQITVLYPAGADFNMDYYMAKHMPLVLDTWKGEGMTGYSVSKFVGAAGGGDSPYSVQAILDFKGVEDFQKAVGGEGAPKIMSDIPNFSNKEPILLVGDVQGTK